MYVLALIVLVTAEPPAIHLTVRSPVQLTDVDRFLGTVKTFAAGEVEASMCELTGEGSRTVGMRKECGRFAKEGVYVNGRLRSGNVRNLAMELCSFPGFLSRECLNFCPEVCFPSTQSINSTDCLSPAVCTRLLSFNETCPAACTAQLLSNALCDPDCDLSGCNYDNGSCTCPSSCTADTRTNQECDLICNTTACNFDDSRCIEGGGGDEGDPSWVKWVIGSLSIVCFL